MDKYVLKTEKSEECRLIPILDGTRVKSSDELHKLLLRLTPQDRYKQEDIETWLNTITDAWVLGKENSKQNKEHYHISIYSPIDEDMMRTQVNIFLIKWFPEPAKRGDANKRYNLTTADSIEKAIQYTVKDKNITYGKGINPKFIEQAVKKSFQKYDKASITQEIEKLKEDYRVDDQLTMRDFMIRFVNIKARYGQPVNENYLYGLAIINECARNPNYAERYVDEIIAKKSKWT